MKRDIRDLYDSLNEDQKKELSDITKHLTSKQILFADKYYQIGNATKAALEAGYAKSRARQSGHDNVTNRYIKARTQFWNQLNDSANIMKADEALQGITAIARGKLTSKKLADDGSYIDIYPTVTERQRAYESILKRYPLSEMDKAQIKKAQAEAVRAEAEANVAKAQAEQLNTVTDKTREKMDKLSADELRNLAKLAGGDDDD